eukprot:PhM_4_TR8373/c0_g1_i1/m.66026
MSHLVPRRAINYDQAAYRAELEQQMKEHEAKRHFVVAEKIGAKLAPSYGQPNQQQQYDQHRPSVGIIPSGESSTRRKTTSPLRSQSPERMRQLEEAAQYRAELEQQMREKASAGRIPTKIGSQHPVLQSSHGVGEGILALGERQYPNNAQQHAAARPVDPRRQRELQEAAVYRAELEQQMREKTAAKRRGDIPAKIGAPAERTYSIDHSQQQQKQYYQQQAPIPQYVPPPQQSYVQNSQEIQQPQQQYQYHQQQQQQPDDPPPVNNISSNTNFQSSPYHAQNAQYQQQQQQQAVPEYAQYQQQQPMVQSPPRAAATGPMPAFLQPQISNTPQKLDPQLLNPAYMNVPAQQQPLFVPAQPVAFASSPPRQPFQQQQSSVMYSPSQQQQQQVVSARPVSVPPAVGSPEAEQQQLPRYGRRSQTAKHMSKEDAQRQHLEVLAQQVEEQKRRKEEEKRLNKRLVQFPDENSGQQNQAPVKTSIHLTKRPEETPNDLSEFLQRQVQEKKKKEEAERQRRLQEDMELERKIQKEVEKMNQDKEREEARRKQHLHADSGASPIAGAPKPIKKLYHHQKWKLENEERHQYDDDQNNDNAHSPQQQPHSEKKEQNSESHQQEPADERHHEPDPPSPPPPPPSMMPPPPAAAMPSYHSAAIDRSLEGAFNRQNNNNNNPHNSAGPIVCDNHSVALHLRNLDNQFDSIVRGISTHQDAIGAMNAKFVMDVASMQSAGVTSSHVADNMAYLQARELQAQQLRRSEAYINSVAESNNRRLDALTQLTSKDSVGNYLNEFLGQPLPAPQLLTGAGQRSPQPQQQQQQQSYDSPQQHRPWMAMASSPDKSADFGGTLQCDTHFIRFAPATGAAPPPPGSESGQHDTPLR